MSRPAVITETFLAGPIGLNYAVSSRRVTAVVHNTALGRRGTVRPGDRILRVNGEPAVGMGDLELATALKSRPVTVDFATGS